MKTSYYSYYTGNDGVSISLYPPKNWKGKIYKPLAPTNEILSDIRAGRINEEQYTIRYKQEVLSKLDPQVIYDIFKDKVLLCYETPREFCHRKIVATWIKEELGIKVFEWHKSDKQIINNISLFP